MNLAGTFSLLLSLLTLALASRRTDTSGLVNTNLIRTVDLQTLPFVKEQVGVVVQNENNSRVFKTYQIVIGKLDKLSQVRVTERKSGHQLETVRLKDYEGVWQVILRKPLQPGEKISLNVDTVYSNLVEARPEAVDQAEDQTWLWKDRVQTRSLYPVKKQKTVVKVSGSIKRFTEHGAALKGGQVTFGPYTDGSEEEAEVLFVDNREQLEAVTHRREYFVSHWSSNLNVLEHYVLRNRGPKLSSGGFDKVKHMMTKYLGQRENLVQTLLVKVPGAARELYFVDEIGNVSSSAVTSWRQPKTKGGEAFKIMQMQPRYLLAGGWNYTWWHGYSLPLSDYLKVAAGRRHHLRVPYVGMLSGSAQQPDKLTVGMADRQNVAVNGYELRVTLPEGAYDVDVRLPVDDLEIRMEPFWYYLDSTGRTVVVVEHRNVAPDLISQHLLVSYTYSGWALWQKPVVVAGVLFGLFVAGSLLNRMSFGLAVKKKAKTQ